MREMLDKAGVSKLWASAKGLFVPKEAGKGLSENDFSDSYKGKIDGLTESYTFVVNSDEALLAWANAEAGNDYTHVLIKSGTWNMSKASGINLSAAGTLTVTGEPGNKIVNIATSPRTVYGLAAQTGSYSAMRITGVNMHVEQHGDTVGLFQRQYAVCFMNLHNLTDCHATGNTKHSIGGYNDVQGFFNCEYLSNCTAVAFVDALHVNAHFDGFFDCKQLVNCYVYANARFNSFYGFRGCEQVSACYVNLNNARTENMFGFYSCTNVSTSVAFLTATNSGTVTGMYRCKYVDSCRIHVEAVHVLAYDTCSYLTACTAESVGGRSDVCYKGCVSVVACRAEPYQLNDGNALCFDECLGVLCCYATYTDYNSSSSADTWFSNSCACQDTYTGRYACANTPEGGWNYHTENTYDTT